MKNGKYTTEDINRSYKDGMLYFILCSYISADFLTEEQKYKEAYIKLRSIHECLPYSILPDDEKERCINQIEGGIAWNDPTLNIDWGISEKDIVLSEKDKCHQTFEQYKNNPDF